ncbi:MAG TPA: glycoside hydrolase family 13 protein [Pedococcus sp.]|uniref:glycoside hydrolase family 13 protein n=1 Tax=Pedococcus sp. TaxID=2860345 RepID=UPI002F94EB9C
MSARESSWWRSAVVYQVYPRSFADADGDGVGDLAGVTSRLGHIASLGADAVWLTPFQRSPQADHGYDVSDYLDVDPLFGTLGDFDTLVERAHDLGMRVIVDLVPNHCSSAHPLFQAALEAGPGSPERARFHFSPGRGDGGELPPNNWPSVFGGPAWSRVPETDGRPGEWYLHLYAPEQPDLNWRHPATHELLDGALRFWLDRGADGVRIDVAHGLFKAEGLPDLADPDIEPMRLRGNVMACDQEEVHEVYRRWRAIADGYVPERVLVGEVNLLPHRAARYVRPDELHQAFAFAFLAAPWDAEAWQVAATGLLDGAARTGSPVTWVVENHDVVRAPTRYGGGEHGLARARAALLTVLALPGSAYVYQGQELGLPEVDVPVEARQDPAWLRSGVTRDGARVPIPWRSDPAGSYGFSDGAPGATPWLPVPPPPEGTGRSGPHWGALSVAAQEDDPSSTLELARAAVQLRRRLHADGVLHPDDSATVRTTAAGLLEVERAGTLLAVNLGGAPSGLPEGELMLSSGPLARDGDLVLLPPDTAAWLRR